MVKEIVENSMETDEYDCAICLEPIKNYVELDCSHRYHKSCISYWFANNSYYNKDLTCPLCTLQVNL